MPEEQNRSRRKQARVYSRGVKAAGMDLYMDDDADFGGEIPQGEEMEKRQRLAKSKSDTLEKWTIEDSADLYGVDHWSGGFFSINENGNVCVKGKSSTQDIDLKDLLSEIRARGLDTPLVIRFTDILRSRLNDLQTAFASAFKENNYTGEYLGVYPIKVNQHRHILEDIVEFGKSYNFGLEAGSKPELLIATAYQSNPQALTICNGFKDRDYIETALRARKMGHKIFIVIERPDELATVLEISKKLKVEPLLGVRIKLASRGKGMWENSGGAKSKFGLNPGQLVEMVKTLKRKKMLPCLQLLHYHIGSQITDIQRIKTALREAAAYLVEINAMGAPMKYIDVGGGMAVDYDGSHTNFASSANYGMHEYASDVVSVIATVCDETGLPHPDIVTECGRAITAHHSMLVVEAVASGGVERLLKVPPVPKNAPEILKRIHEAYDSLSPKNFQEVYHDAVEARKEALMLFSLRHLSLQDRAKIEDFFWIICRRIAKYAQKLDYMPDEFDGLAALSSSAYYCNFSIFQSLPDHWAIKQLFPVVPLQRLGEKPTVDAILADMTCDSDGVMDKFVDLHDVKDTLPLHSLRKNERYDLGIFLTGAYQAILGDLHNLFGDVAVVHVSSHGKGYMVDRTIDGNKIREVLGFVEFNTTELLQKYREQIDRALSSELITPEEGSDIMRHAEKLLDDPTYLGKLY